MRSGIMNISDEFKNVIAGKTPDKGVFVPLLRWFSGSESNIEALQRINMRFSHTNQAILINQLILNNKVKHFISYPPPKAKKEDKDAFFYIDLQKYLGMSSLEFKKNLSVIDIDGAKAEVARAFGYDNAQRKIIGLKPLDILKKVKKVKNLEDGKR